MRRFGLRTKREAVNYALRDLAFRLSAQEVCRLRGTGWDGDLEELRGERPTPA